MTVLRFDFASLQDFRLPPEPVMLAEITKAELEEVAPPPPPTFSEAELEAAKRKEYQRGHTEGIKEGHAQAHGEDEQRHIHIEQMLTGLVQEIAQLKHKHETLLRLQCTELTHLVMLITRKVAGDVIQNTPRAGIEDMVNKCLGVLMHQAKVTLHVHPSLEEDLATRMQVKLKQAGIEAELLLATDDTLAPGEGRLEWRDGMAERNIGDLWIKIEQMLAAVDFTALVDETQSNLNQTTQATSNKGENHE